MAGLRPDVDPEGLLEYSVVYTDRALNHMSQSFQEVMRDIGATLRRVYHADAVAVVPGSGTFGMEAVARQLATGKRCLVIRNGWFSFRWSQIFEAGESPPPRRCSRRAAWVIRRSALCRSLSPRRWSGSARSNRISSLRPTSRRPPA